MARSLLCPGVVDRAIEAPRGRRRLAAALVAAAATLAAITWLAPGHHALRVDRARLTIAEVTRGPFEDFIPLIGDAAPPRSVFLDVPEGGRVEKIAVEPGATVTAGELLVQLSNPALQLDVISREAQVTEQLNNLRNTELALAQARLAQQGELIEVESLLEKFETSSRRFHGLEGLIATAETDESDRQLRYYQRRRTFLLHEQAVSDQLRRKQLDQLTESTTMLQRHLAFARDHLHDLEIRAPYAGTLSSLDVQLGQSLQRGQRAGQIDLPGAFKLVAHVDQFYAGRIAVGQRARLATGDTALHVAKLYPLVENGQFAIDLEFAAPPIDLRRGQAVQVQLFLDQTVPAVLVPNGAFVEHTGGHWIFVVTGDHATRRAIELGRKNPRFVEVVRGLAPGERVVTSSYASYAEIETLELE